MTCRRLHSQTGARPSYLTLSPDVVQLQGRVVRDVAWEPQSLGNTYPVLTASCSGEGLECLITPLQVH